MTQFAAVGGIVQLSAANFDSVVYNSPTAWFVDFQIPWCGYCAKFRQEYERFVQENPAWSAIARFAVINCEYDEICSIRFQISNYPTLLYFSPMASPYAPASRITADVTTVPLMGLIVDMLSREIRHPYNWPVLRQTSPQEITDSITSGRHRQSIIYVDPDDYDILSRILMLDFSGYKDMLPIMRVSYSTAISSAQMLNMDVRGQIVPSSLLLLDGNRNALIRIDDPGKFVANPVPSLRIYYGMLISQQLRNFNIAPVPISIPGAHPMGREIPVERIRQVNMRYANVVHMDDLDACISYILRVEIPRKGHVEGEAMRALKNIMNLLVECYPGRHELMGYLESLREFILYQPSIDGAQLRRMTLDNNGRYILPPDVEWKHCYGSQPQYRGYPCSLWMLFHILTVGHAVRRSSGHPSIFSAADVISAIVDYIYNFFSCYMCRSHFQMATSSHREELRYKSDAVLYLWEIHNRVNKRLAGDATEDPSAPKIQFPSPEDCPQCFQNVNGQLIYDSDNTYRFLCNYYTSIVAD